MITAIRFSMSATATIPRSTRRRTVHRVDTDQATDDGERDVNPVEGSQTRDEPNHESNDGQDSPHQCEHLHMVQSAPEGGVCERATQQSD